MDEESVPCKFYSEGRCRFGEDCRNMHVGEVHIVSGSKSKSKKSKTKNARSNSPGDEVSKLPSMKTARDVIQRIQWDPDMPPEHFTVGYLDRFVGIVEQRFDLFDWTSDLASVDHQNVLAIPQHRIQYFKYRGKKVWDKAKRVDLIFGSTLSVSTDITRLLRSIDEELLYKDDTIQEMEDDNLTPADSDQNEPTHFLAIRIDDADLVRELDSVVLKLAGNEKVAGKISPALYHCTLALLRLDSVDKVAACSQSLRSMGPGFFLDPPKSLQLHGLSTFSDRILFSRVCQDPKLDSLVSSLVGFLNQSSVQVLERPKEFHVSLVKGRKNVSRFDKEKFGDFDVNVFGHQPVNFIHLCTLREAPDLDGFYKVVTSVDLSRN